MLETLPAPTTTAIHARDLGEVDVVVVLYKSADSIGEALRSVPPPAKVWLVENLPGDGSVDAIFNAIKALYPHEAELQLFQVHAVTEGTDAQAEVSVRLEENGKTVTGRGADTDTLVAAAKAYLNALNKLLIKRQKTAPEAMSATS